MDISSVGNISSSIMSARTGDAVAVSVFRKSLETQAQGAMQLIGSLPSSSANTQPVGSLGNKVNTFA
jgi:hypothetical protein